VVISFLAISEGGFVQARPVVIAVVSIFALLSSFLFIRKKRGKITNLDVSDRKQRARNVYLPALGMLAVATLYFQWTGQHYVNETIFIGSLIGTCFAINSVKKISLHTVVATYLSALIIPVNAWIALGFFTFSLLIAWSRVVLGRHTKAEVLLGWLVGTGFGFLHNWLL
jgi:membrane-associated phospholipid phosphatase